LLYLINNFICSVLSHHYGKDGRETSKVDSTGIVIDYELFQNLVNNDFTSNALSSIQSFVETLNTPKPGKYLFIECSM